MRILIAEDDFASRKMMQKFMSQYGDCDVTVDGAEAAEAFSMAVDEEEPYDLVCLDVMMPVMDGFQALKEIRDMEIEQEIVKEERVKVIMMTALGAERKDDPAVQAGYVAYAPKPVDFAKLKELLATMGMA